MSCTRRKLACLLLLASTCAWSGANDPPAATSSPKAAAPEEPRPTQMVELPRLRGPRLAQAKRPASPYRGEYDFRANWFTWNIPIWEKALEPYRGRAHLRYLEIGVYEGRSAVWMLEQILTAPSSTMVGIDPFVQERGPEIEKRFRENVGRAGATDRVTLIKGHSQVELRKLPLESFDIIYIDGSHRAADVLEDAVLSWRLLKPGGMLIFDDYLWRVDRLPLDSRPEKAVYDFYWFFQDEFEVIHADYQVLLRRHANP